MRSFKGLRSAREVYRCQRFALFNAFAAFAAFALSMLSTVAAFCLSTCAYGSATVCAQDGSSYSYTEAVSGSVRTIVTNHCPNHPYYNLNPNVAVDSSTTYTIPASPTYVGAASDSSLSSAFIDLSAKGGAVGVFFNGAMLYSPYGGPTYGTASSFQTSATYAEGNTFDQCGCHASSTTSPSYHCHVPPTCLMRQLGQTDTAHSPQIGWAFDGFPVYGPRGPSGTMMQTCTQTGGTYGSDVCTDYCGGHYNADGSVDSFVYRYYTLGDYNDGTSCDEPGCPSPGAEYFPFSTICFRGCCPSGVTCASGITSCPSSDTLSGTTSGYTGAVPTINSFSLASGLPTNADACACDNLACNTPCASEAWSSDTCGAGSSAANSCPTSSSGDTTSSSSTSTGTSDTSTLDVSVGVSASSVKLLVMAIVPAGAFRAM